LSCDGYIGSGLLDESSPLQRFFTNSQCAFVLFACNQTPYKQNNSAEIVNVISLVLLDEDVVDWDEEYPPQTGEEYSQSKTILLPSFSCSCLFYFFYF